MDFPRFFAAALGVSASLAAAPFAFAGGHDAAPQTKNPAPPPPLKLPRPQVAPDTTLRPRKPILPPSEFMPVSQLKAGMTGYGLSVFQGSKIERFNVKILGVMRKVNNGRDLILVKLSGPQMQRVTDVIAGMSGSPVYINGKIVGAVSYGSQFTRESIGYLTPIEDMLDAWDPALPQTFEPASDAQTEAALLPQPLRIDGLNFTHIALARPFSPVSPTAAPGTLVLRPLAAKVTVSGISASRWDGVKAVLQKMGLDARQGPGGAGVRSSGLKGSALVPGGAIAMSLATGDIDITGIGTLTYRRKNQVVAFGHPFLNIGPLDAPMYTAYIHDIEPSFSESSKIGSPVSLVGSFSQDRPFSIGGRIGAKPVLVPITVRVQDKAFGRDRVFHAQVIRHPQITPQLIPVAAGTAISEVHGQPGDAMATVTTSVTADEVGTITRTNRVYDGGAIDSAAISDLMSLMSLLSANPFYPVSVRNVTMSVAIEPGRKTAQVERIYLNQSRYEPGETVEVGVVLKPYKKPSVIKTMRVVIPPSTRPGILTLTVGGGGSGGGSASAGLLGILLGGRGAGPDYATATNIKQLVEKYKERDRNDDLVAKLQLPTSAISIGGEKMPGLPANLETVLRGGGGSAAGGNLPRSSGVRLERDEVKVSDRMDYVISGSQALPIRVARKNAPPAPTFGSPFGSPGGTTITLPPPGSGGQIPASPPPGGANIVILPPDEGPDEEPLAVLPKITAPPASGNSENSGNAGKPNNPLLQMMSDLNARSNPGASDTSPAPSANAEKPVNRQPGVWRQTSLTDFRTALELNGVTVTGAGDIRLAPRLSKITETTEPYFWCLAPDTSGGVYAGSGDTGLIYHVQNGKAEPFSKTGELEVFSLVRAKNGDLYAGTAPNGRIFRVTPDGKATLWWQAGNAKYVLSLQLSPDEKTLYAGLGGPSARVVSLPLEQAKPTAQTLYESDESSATALALSPSGELYAGTAPSGLIVHVAGANVTRPTVVYDAGETAISGLAIDAKTGELFAAATAPRSVLYRITPGANARVLYDKLPPGAVLSDIQLAGSTLYAATGSTVYAIDTADETVQTFEAASDIQILSLLADTNDAGRVWAATGSTGGVYALAGDTDQGIAKGEFVSSVLDTKSTAKWGTLRWTAEVPTGASVQFETRSGDTFDPDKTWSAWSAPYTRSGGETIISPPARYLQYRALLSGAANKQSPQIKAVEAFYLPPNQGPQVTLVSPKGGEVWNGKNTVRWAASDADKDTLLFDIDISGDNGKTWKPLQSAAKALVFAKNVIHVPGEASVDASPKQPLVVPPARSGASSNALAEELSRHPEISQEMRNRILADAPPAAVSQNPAVSPQTQTRSEAASAQSARTARTNAPVSTRETTAPLDTTRFDDGTYLVRVRATDAPSNPDGALSAEKVSGEFRIVNRAPLLVLFKKETSVGSDKTATLKGLASHPLVSIRAVQYRIDGGQWMAARADDGIFDASTEAFTLTTAPLETGPHTVEVQTQDEAGNTAAQTTEVAVK